MLLNSIPAYIKRGIPSGKPRSAPLLPNELWLRILEIVSRPTVIIGDDYYSPDDIEICAKTRMLHETAHRARSLFRKNRRHLRAVCRLWRHLVDSIIEEEWSIDACNLENTMERLEDSDSWTVQRERPLSRLNMLFLSAFPIVLSHFRPVSSFTLVVATKTKGDERPTLDSLSSIIPCLTSLRSLHLTLGNIQRLPGNLFDQIAHPNVYLLTLSLKTSIADVFTSDLTFPHLTTLCFHIANEGVTETSRQTSWILPSLINLSLEFAILIKGTPKASFISRLLVHHSSQLRSLRLISPHNTGLDTSSPAFWAAYPKLEVLATDFSSFLYDQTGQPLQKGEIDSVLQKAWSESLPLRHLIQNGNPSPSVFIGGLKRAIGHCSKLDTISLAPKGGHLFGKPSRFWTYWKLPQEERVAVRKLEKLCRSRGVRILDEEGWEMEDIIKEKCV